MTIFQQVYDLFGSEEFLIAFANSKGESFQAGDMAISQKFAALTAAAGAAYTHVLSQYGTVSEERFLQTLRRIAANDMSEALGRLADYVAHVTWLSGQPFRGSEKIARIPGFTFVALPPEEAVKDREHIVWAAKFIVERLDAQSTAAAA